MYIIHYIYYSLYLLPASFGCLLRAAERQPATLRFVKPWKSSKMVKSKDKVDILFYITFFSIWIHFYFMSAVICGRAAICGRRFRQFASIFRGQKTKKFINGKKNPHAKFQPFNFSNTGFGTPCINSKLWIYTGCPKVNFKFAKSPSADHRGYEIKMVPNWKKMLSKKENLL